MVAKAFIDLIASLERFRAGGGHSRQRATSVQRLTTPIPSKRDASASSRPQPDQHFKASIPSRSALAPRTCSSRIDTGTEAISFNAAVAFVQSVCSHATDEGLPGVLTITRSPPSKCEPFEHDVVDPWPTIDQALDDVAKEYRNHPVGCLREKDFESRLFGILRDAKFPRVPFWLPDGSCVSIDPVRAQWSGEWANSLGRGRRHDLVVLHPSGRALLAELELKTSHSDSHNWFRKRDVEAELQAMHHLVEVGMLRRGRFVMFRYGSAKWEADAKALFKRYPHVEFSYICA